MTKKRNEIDDPIGVLSLRLNAAFQRRNGADWLDVRRRARRQRAPLSWSRRRVLVLAGTLVLGVVACAGSTGVIPWLNHHPLKIQAPLLAPPCRVSDLRVSLGYSVNLRSTDGGFKLENRGRRACSLAGRPRVALVDPRVSGSRLHVISEPPQKSPPGALDFWPPSLLRAVPPGKVAVASFTWSNWCGPGAAPKAVEFRLPDGERIVRSFASSQRDPHSQLGPGKTAPRCYRSRGQTSLEYDAFFPAWTPSEVLSTYQFNARLPLRATLITKGLETVRKRVAPGMYDTYFRLQRGSVFHYRIVLRNTSRRSFHFTECPLYSETLGGPGNASNAYRSETYVLNCSSAGTIKPGGRAYFAMELRVPKNQQLGMSDLMWLLHDGNSPSGTPDITTWVVP